MRSSSAQVLDFLRSCRRRILGLEAAAGLFWAFCAVLLAVLVFLLVFLFAGGLFWVRGAVLWALGAGVLLVAYLYGLKPFLRFRPGAPLAREVERRLPGEPMSLELVSAVQLDRALPGLLKRPVVSPDLVAAHLDTVADRLAKVEPREVAPGRRILKPLGLVFALSLAVLILGVLFPADLARAVGSMLHAPDAPLSGAGTLESSWVGDIRLAYEYPAYTGRRRRSVDGTDGTILALPGTRVAIASRADRDIMKASLSLGDRALELRVAPGRRLEGEMVVMQAGSYRFELQDHQGRKWQEPRAHAINLEADKPPVVRLTEPKTDLVVREQDAVDLLYDARDDFGLQEIRLVYRVSSRPEGEQSRVLERFSKAKRRVRRRDFHWDLASLQLEPGDTVQFYIEGLDADTVLGPKAGRTATRSLKVFSAREQHEKLSQRAQQLWEQLLSLLGDGLDLDPGVSQEKQRAEGLEPYRGMHQKTRSFVEELAGLIGDMHKDQLTWRPLFQALVNVNGGVRQLNSELGYALQGIRQKRDPGLTANMLSGHRLRRVRRMERDVLYLEDLLDLMRLEDLDRIAQELDRARQRLSELMRQYAQAPNDETRKEIESEIARLKEKIQKLLARQADVLKSIRDEYLNPEALQKMLSQKDMMGTLDKIQKLMMEGKIEEALAELARLQEQLKSLQTAIDRSRAEYGTGKYAELAQAMARMQGELNMITETQRKLMESTGKIRKRLIDRLKQTGEAKLKALFSKLRKRVKKVVSQIEGIDKAEMDAYMSQDIDGILQNSKMLDMLLKALDVAGSLDTSQNLAQLTDRLQRSLMGFARYQGRFDPSRRKKLEAGHRRSQEADREAQAILLELKKIMPDASKLLSKGDLDKLGKLAKRQEDLQKRLRGLGVQMRSINDQAPVFGQGAMNGIQRGSSHMQRAAGDLSIRKPRGAFPHQQSALSELQALQKAMQQGCKQGGG
jgi:plastocyanin